MPNYQYLEHVDSTYFVPGVKVLSNERLTSGISIMLGYNPHHYIEKIVIEKDTLCRVVSVTRTVNEICSYIDAFTVEVAIDGRLRLVKYAGNIYAFFRRA